MRLEPASYLAQIQILAHENRVSRVAVGTGSLQRSGKQPCQPNTEMPVQVPTQVELLLGNAAQEGADPEHCTWRPLGTLTFASNEKSGFQARELKSATFPPEHAALLRLIVRGAHPNSYNRHGQVCAARAYTSVIQAWLGDSSTEAAVHCSTSAAIMRT